MKKYVLTTVMIGSILVLSACKPVEWTKKEWNSIFHSSDEKKHTQKDDKDKKNEDEENPTKEVDALPDQNLPWLDDTVAVAGDGKETVQNVDDILVVANKERNLPSDYEPKDLVTPNIPFPFKEDLPKKKMREEAARAIEKLFAAAEENGLQLLAQSGYRSYDTQVSIFAYNADQYGEEKANQVSAQPGQSEHQTGLTMDVTSPEMDYKLDEKFGETKEGKWLADHADEYGFIIRYPKGKEKITGYQYEPWHIRYVGIDNAKEIHKRGITLEEYLQKP